MPINNFNFIVITGMAAYICSRSHFGEACLLLLNYATASYRTIDSYCVCVCIIWTFSVSFISKVDADESQLCGRREATQSVL